MVKKTSPTAKVKTAGLDEIVGEQAYAVWLDMLKRLVPEGRTHRLAPTIAAMLQYATVLATEKYGDEPEKDSVAAILLSAYDDNDEEIILPIVQRLFKDARVEYERVSRGGEHYSVAEEAAHQYLGWFNMPWED